MMMGLKMVEKIQVKSILNKHKVRDSWFLENYTLNPYLGCSFDCIYCYVHGSKYGEHITNHLKVKANAPEVLYRQLKNRAKNREYGIIALGSATDPYLYLEKELKLTQELLRIIYRFHFPLNIMTKSSLILRDVDILKKIDEKAHLPDELQKKLNRGVIISFSFSTMSHKLAEIFEPAAPTPKERLETMKSLADEGFKVGACLMPVLPFLSDTPEQLDYMIQSVKEHGGSFVLVGGLTLFGDKPSDCRTRYYNALREHYPAVLSKTEKLFGKSSYPSYKYQKNLAKMVEVLCKEYRIKNRII
jgi:DNA repair photolyase